MMFEWCFLSINTLSNHVNKDNIIVFFTPPREENQVEALQSLGIDVRTVENSTDSFRVFDTKQERHYGEKTWISTVEDDTVVFLDCDTLVFGDITEVIEGDFQFKARRGEDAEQLRKQKEWEKMFERFNEQYIDWMPNTGFLIFKQGTHKQIGDKWRKYINKDFEFNHGNMNLKEQYTLSLVIGSLDVEKMGIETHAMLWRDEFVSDGVVYHTGDIFNPPAAITDHSRLVIEKIANKLSS
jgi:hypothetical protein